MGEPGLEKWVRGGKNECGAVGEGGERGGGVFGGGGRGEKKVGAGGAPAEVFVEGGVPPSVEAGPVASSRSSGRGFGRGIDGEEAPCARANGLKPQ